MADRAAATIGFVVTGVAFAAALSWQTHGVGLALIGLTGLALLGFSLRRYGRVDRIQGTSIAGVASATAAAVAFAVLVVPGIGPDLRTGTGADARIVGALGITATAGLGGVVAAYADWHGVGRVQLGRQAVATTRGLLVGFAGLAAIYAWGIALASVLRRGGGDVDPTVGTVVSTFALGLGTGTVAYVYLRRTDRGIAFLDLEFPTLGDLGYVVGGVLLVLGLNVGISLAFRELGIESASHSIIRAAQTSPNILLVLIPLSYLVIGPGEELLYRNVIQKALYESFSSLGAVVVASAIFAAAHIFAFANPGDGLLSTLNTLIVIFLLSLVLGAVYERTRNIVVPMLVHSTFNAIAFAITYVELSGTPDPFASLRVTVVSGAVTTNLPPWLPFVLWIPY